MLKTITKTKKLIRTVVYGGFTLAVTLLISAMWGSSDSVYTTVVPEAFADSPHPHACSGDSSGGGDGGDCA